MEIVILDSGYQSYDYEKELFGNNGFDLKIYPSCEGDPSEKRIFAKNANGILLRHTRIDRGFLSEMKTLKAIVRYGVGYDNIDIAACTESGIAVRQSKL
jgi:D-3-phosphoglycerate dehydrogenase